MKANANSNDLTKRTRQVAVSRARACLIVVGDKSRCATSKLEALRKLAEYPKPSNLDNVSKNLFESPWKRKFYDALKNAGILQNHNILLLEEG